jgi:hypothetical protein
MQHRQRFHRLAGLAIGLVTVATVVCLRAGDARA